MINPGHECAWTRRRRTDLSLSGGRLAGAGVSPRVLYQTFSGRDLTWYSLVYGDFDDKYLAMGVDAGTAAALAHTALAGVSTIGEALQAAAVVREGVLREQIQSALGVTLTADDYRLEKTGKVQYCIHIPNDCCFGLEPADEGLMRTLTANVLELHACYLNREVDWSGVREQIAGLILKAGAVRIVSDPRRKRLTLSWRKIAASRIERLLNPYSSRQVEVGDGFARFTT